MKHLEKSWQESNFMQVSMSTALYIQRERSGIRPVKFHEDLCLRCKLDLVSHFIYKDVKPGGCPVRFFQPFLKDKFWE